MQRLDLADVLKAIAASPHSYSPGSLNRQAVVTIRAELMTKTLVELGGHVLTSPTIIINEKLQPETAAQVRVSRVLVYQREGRCEVILIGESNCLYPGITNVHANIALAVAGDGTGDYTLDVFMDPDCRREVVRCQWTEDGWNFTDISRFVEDLLLSEHGEFIAKCSENYSDDPDKPDVVSWVTPMTAQELFYRLDNQQVVVDDKNGFPVKSDAVLVRVEDPNDIIPGVSVFRYRDNRLFRYTDDPDDREKMFEAFKLEHFPRSPATLGRMIETVIEPTFGSAPNTSSASQTSV